MVREILHLIQLYILESKIATIIAKYWWCITYLAIYKTKYLHIKHFQKKKIFNWHQWHLTRNLQKYFIFSPSFPEFLTMGGSFGRKSGSGLVPSGNEKKVNLWAIGKSAVCYVHCCKSVHTTSFQCALSGPREIKKIEIFKLVEPRQYNRWTYNIYIF